MNPKLMKRRIEKASKPHFYNIFCLFKVRLCPCVSFFKAVAVIFSKSQNRVFSKKLLILCGFNSSDRNHSVVLMFELSPFVFPQNKLKHIGHLCCYLACLYISVRVFIKLECIFFVVKNFCFNPMAIKENFYLSIKFYLCHHRVL